MRSAKSCLKKLGTYQEFDYVGADDGVKRPKPEADMFLEFQHKFNLKPEEIAVVGDTYNDVVFARNNGGIAIGVLSGVSSEEDFRERQTISWTLLRTCPGAPSRGCPESGGKKHAKGHRKDAKESISDTDGQGGITVARNSVKPCI